MDSVNAERFSRRTIVFVNVAHAFDHFVLLIYPTAVIAIAAERRLDYASLIGLATGAFVAFGLFSLPMGWIAERVGRRNLLAVFFGGYGLACLGLSTAGTSAALAAWLLALGVFAAIYHPIGTAMLVTHTRKLGRDLGWNGVWGNIGAAAASAVTAMLAVTLGWRAAFVLPGLVCLGVGIAFVLMVQGDGGGARRGGAEAETAKAARPYVLLAVFALALVASGLTFNVTTIALPKVIDERMGLALPLAVTGWLATAVFGFGALTQLIVGRLVDRLSLMDIFAGLSLLQPLGLGLAAATTGAPMLAGLVMTMAAIYGQVIVNDVMVARYVPAQYRAKAYSVRYFLGFTASGFAAPLIAVMHAHGGFPALLAVTAAFGAVILACALAFRTIAAQPAPAPRPAAAE